MEEYKSLVENMEVMTKKMETAQEELKKERDESRRQIAHHEMNIVRQQQIIDALQKQMTMAEMMRAATQPRTVSQPAVSVQPVQPQPAVQPAPQPVSVQPALPLVPVAKPVQAPTTPEATVLPPPSGELNEALSTFAPLFRTVAKAKEAKKEAANMQLPADIVSFTEAPENPNEPKQEQQEQKTTTSKSSRNRKERLILDD
jgi:hypothetical protein